MKDLSGFLPIFGILIATIFLTLVEIFSLKISKRVDSPKFVWFPISANVIGFIVIIVAVFFAIVFFAIGFITAFGAGFDAGEKYFYVMIFVLVLIPILIFSVRTILFLLFKLGKFPFALLYSLLTTLVNLVVIILTAVVFFEAHARFFK